MRRLIYYVFFIIALVPLQTILSQEFYEPSSEEAVVIKWNSIGTLVASGHYNGNVKLWTEDGFLVAEMQISQSPIVALTWNNDNHRLLISSGDTNLVIWDTQTQELLPIQHSSASAFSSLSWGEVGLFAATHSADNGGSKTLWVWDTNLQLIDIVGRPPSTSSLALSPNHLKIATGDLDGIRIENVINLTPLTSPDTIFLLTQGNGWVTELIWSDDGQILIAGYLNAKILIWDMNNPNEPIGEFISRQNPNQNQIYDVYNRVSALRLNGQLLTSVSGTGEIRIWDLITGQMLNQQILDTDKPITADFNPVTNQIAYDGIGDTGIQITDVCTLSLTSSLEADLISIVNQVLSFSQATICLTENATYILTSPLPTITGDITIIGNGASIVMAGAGRAFDVAETGNLTLCDVTVIDGE